MSVLNDAFDIKLGDTQVSKVYLGDTLIWPWEAFWKFSSPDAGQTLQLNNIFTTTGFVTIDWGDRNIITYGSGNPNAFITDIEHVYSGDVRYTGFNIVNMSELRRFWTTGRYVGGPDYETYRFGGTVDLAFLGNVDSYFMSEQGADIINFNQLTTTIGDFRHNDGSVTADTSQLNLSRLPNLVIFTMSGNQITGSVHDLSTLPELRSYNLSTNLLTGTLPDLSNSQLLNTFLLNGNNLSGEIPSIETVGSDNPENNTNVTLSNNNFTSIASNFTTNTQTNRVLLNNNQINSPLPTFDTNYSNVFQLDFSTNQFTGELTSLVDVGSSRNDNVTIFLDDNNISSVATNFQVNANLQRLHVNDNNLSTADLDKILLEVDNLNTSNGFLQIHNNSGTPTNTTSITNLTTRGWTVSYN